MSVLNRERGARTLRRTAMIGLALAAGCRGEQGTAPATGTLTFDGAPYVVTLSADGARVMAHDSVSVTFRGIEALPGPLSIRVTPTGACAAGQAAVVAPEGSAPVAQPVGAEAHFAVPYTACSAGAAYVRGTSALVATMTFRGVTYTAHAPLTVR